MTIGGFLSGLFTLLTLAGCAYMLVAAWLVRRLRAPAPAPQANAPSVTLLKPLHGPEPLLTEKLADFLAQDYPGAVEMVCGVADARDPAADAARAVNATLIVDGTRHGANSKISNLANMAGHATGDLIVLSDDDIAVAPDYLRRVVAALDAPGVGCVTCLYAGRGDAGWWSRIAAAGISWQFLPNVVVGLALGLARPCMGSTIAMRRETLAAIGGFAPFADTLADDYAIGAAVRGLGLRVAVPPMLVTHGSGERYLAELIRHELRWLATVRGLDPAGYAGSILTYPLPLAILALLSGADWWLAGLAAAARLALVLAVDRVAGRRTAPLWTLPFRDLLGFALFVSAFFARSVDWRGSRLVMAGSGRILAPKEPFDS